MPDKDPNEAHELVSGYRSRNRYLNLRWQAPEGDRPGSFFYTGSGCGGGYGLTLTREEVLEEFAGQVAQDRVKLEHYAGAKVRDVFADAEGQPMTTAEFKRRMVKGSRWTLEHVGSGSVGAREVVHVQADDFACIRDGHVNSRGNWTWMQFVKGERLRELEGGVIVILDGRTGKPFMRYTPVTS